jgi:hypothetical protein
MHIIKRSLPPKYHQFLIAKRSTHIEISHRFSRICSTAPISSNSKLRTWLICKLPNTSPSVLASKSMSRENNLTSNIQFIINSTCRKIFKYLWSSRSSKNKSFSKIVKSTSIIKGKHHFKRRSIN